jgi:L-ascorbate metabolism protein UlaG (beta-lactamase superfamily)
MNPSPRNVVARPTVHLGPDAFGPSDATSLWWLTMAGFLINSRGMLIAIDPAISYVPGTSDQSETGYRLLVPLPIEAPDVPKLDVILISHSDHDHLAPITDLELIRTGATFVGPRPVVSALRNLGVPEDRLIMVKAGDTARFGVVEIGVTRASHAWQVLDPARFGPPFGPDDCCGFRVGTPDGIIWHPGDTILLDEHLEQSNVDVFLPDISRGDFHMGPESAARLADALGPRHVIPHHYGCYDDPDNGALNGDPFEFATNIHDGAERIHILAPGERFDLSR